MIDPALTILALMGLFVLVSALLDNEAIARSKSPKVLGLGMATIACGVVFLKFRQLLMLEDVTVTVTDLLLLRHLTWGSGFVVIGYAFSTFFVLAPLVRWWK